MSVAASVPCDLLPWDTDFFGFRVARVVGHALFEEQAVRIDAWCRANHIRGLYFLARNDDPATIRTAEKHGYALVDIRVTFEYAFRKTHPLPVPDLPAGTVLRLFRTEDLLALQAIARAGHRDTRFFSDPHFGVHRAEELYASWITAACGGQAQAVWVAASPTDEPLGYISCQWDAVRRHGNIGLVAVAEGARRQGIGKGLVAAALSWYRERGAITVTVVTQGKNRPAGRLYEQCGFLLNDLQLWYHKWYPADPAPNAGR